jgi:hypothetical protein
MRINLITQFFQNFSYGFRRIQHSGIIVGRKWKSNHKRICDRFSRSLFRSIREVLTFCSRESTSCINEIKDIILHIDDREWLNKKFWIFDDSTPEETGYLFGEVAVVSNSEYRTHAFYQLASKKIVLLIPNDKSLKPIFFSIFEFLEILEWWKNIITKIEEGEIKVDLISQLKNKSI